MKNKFYLMLLLGIVFITFNACKDDCEAPIEITQDYKVYQNWYPYKENDILRFFRPIENDTITFIGGKFEYPTYDIIVGCDCCGIARNEYLSQTFRDTVNKYDLLVEMDGRNITFTLFNAYEYLYDFGGNELLYAEIVTPDSVYKMANKKEYSGHTCYYSPRIGIVKYAYENNGSWLFLRKP